jgi:hypothetical protein
MRCVTKPPKAKNHKAAMLPEPHCPGLSQAPGNQAQAAKAAKLAGLSTWLVQPAGPMRIRYLLDMAKPANNGCTQALSARTKIQMPKLEITALKYPLQRFLPGKSSVHCHAAWVNKALLKVSKICGRVKAKSRASAPKPKKLAKNTI